MKLKGFVPESPGLYNMTYKLLKELQSCNNFKARGFPEFGKNFILHFYNNKCTFKSGFSFSQILEAKNGDAPITDSPIKAAQ